MERRDFLAAMATPALAAAHLVEGLRDAKVRVIIYEDLQCGDCRVLRRMMDDKLLPRYGDRVAFEHRDFPLPKHSWARRAALAARWIGQQQPALEPVFRRETLAALRSITPETLADHVAAFATRHQLDAAAAAKSMEDTAVAKLVEEDYQEGIIRGVAKTPTIFVNGRPFIEVFTYEEVAKTIDELLAARG
jgi:protein-disulfide isomerase